MCAGEGLSEGGANNVAFNTEYSNYVGRQFSVMLSKNIIH